MTGLAPSTLFLLPSYQVAFLVCVRVQTLLSFFHVLRGLFSRMSVCPSVSVLQSATKSAQCMGLDWRGSWCAPAAPMTSRAQSIMSLNITANSLSEHHAMIMVTRTHTHMTSYPHMLWFSIESVQVTVLSHDDPSLYKICLSRILAAVTSEVHCHVVDKGRDTFLSICTSSWESHIKIWVTVLDVIHVFRMNDVSFKFWSCCLLVLIIIMMTRIHFDPSTGMRHRFDRECNNGWSVTPR